MEKKQWTRATRKNGHRVPKLWIRESGTYYAQLSVFDPNTETNVTRKICLDTKKLSVAEEKLNKLLGQRAEGELQIKDHGPLFKDFLPHFLDIREQQRHKKTYQNEKCFLQQFEEFIDQKRLGEITVRDIFDYRKKILDGGITNHTANLHIISIRNLFKQAIIEGYTEENPASKVSKLKHTPKQKFLLKDEQIQLLAKTAKENLPSACRYSANFSFSPVSPDCSVNEEFPFVGLESVQPTISTIMMLSTNIFIQNLLTQTLGGFNFISKEFGITTLGQLNY